jgi:hypothetical protein
MEPEGSLPHSQDPATCPYPKPYQSRPRHRIPLLEDLQVPNLKSLFLCLSCTKESVQVRNYVICFVTWFFFYVEELLTLRPTPKLEDHRLSAVRDCLFNVFAATLHIRRPFLHPQPENAPCRGNRDPQFYNNIII